MPGTEGTPMYFVTPTGELIIEFDKDDICKVVGVQNETWFKHENITNYER